MRIVLVLATVAFLISCGGGGESSVDNSLPDVEGDIVDGNGSMDDGVPPVEVDVTGNDTNSDSQNDNPPANGGESNDDETDEPPIDSGDGVSGQQGPQDSPDTATGPIVIFADGGPAPGIPGGFIDDFRLIGIDDTGVLLADATVRGSFTGEVAWAGSAQAPTVLYKAGDPLAGNSSDDAFAKLVTGSAATNGSLVVLVDTQEGSRALVLIDAIGRQVLLREGDLIEGPYDDELNSGQAISGLLAVRHSNAGLLVLVELVQGNRIRPSRLWLERTEDGFTQLIRSYNSVLSASSLGPSVAVDGSTECRLYASEGDPSSGSNGGMVGLADSGQMIVDGMRVCDASPVAQAKSVIARRAPGGQWETIVVSGSGVPGAPEAIYGEISARRFSDDAAQALVQAQLSVYTGVGEFETDSVLESFWVHPLSAPTRLVSIQGESIQVGDQSLFLGAGGISGGTASLIDQRNGIISLSLVGRRGAGMILRGVPHDATQPHASLAAPGAASLAVVAAIGTTELPGLPEGTRFTALSAAELDDSGNLYFVAVTEGQTVNAEPELGLWRADANDQLTLLISENDETNIGGVPRELGDLLLNITTTPGSFLRATDRGDLYFITRLRDAAADSAAFIRLPATAIQ